MNGKLAYKVAWLLLGAGIVFDALGALGLHPPAACPACRRHRSIGQRIRNTHVCDWGTDGG